MSEVSCCCLKVRHVKTDHLSTSHSEQIEGSTSAEELLSAANWTCSCRTVSNTTRTHHNVKLLFFHRTFVFFSDRNLTCCPFNVISNDCKWTDLFSCYLFAKYYCLNSNSALLWGSYESLSLDSLQWICSCRQFVVTNCKKYWHSGK